jgi:photosystem II stability/assembly factor-like uncharacterized protein
MNTLSKVLAVFCVLLSAVAFASWTPTTIKELHLGNSPTWGVALTTSADGKTVYWSIGGALYKSIDGGETWAFLK